MPDCTKSAVGLNKSRWTIGSMGGPTGAGGDRLTPAQLVPPPPIYRSDRLPPSPVGSSHTTSASSDLIVPYHIGLIGLHALSHRPIMRRGPEIEPSSHCALVCQRDKPSGYVTCWKTLRYTSQELRPLMARSPMSERFCLPSKLMSAHASYARSRAAWNESPMAVTWSTRPPDVTSSPSSFRAVPAW